MEYTKEVQAEEDDDQAGYNIYNGLVGSQEAADGSRQRTEDYECLFLNRSEKNIVKEAYLHQLVLLLNVCGFV